MSMQTTIEQVDVPSRSRSLPWTASSTPPTFRSSSTLFGAWRRRHAAADHRPCRPALHGKLGSRRPAFDRPDHARRGTAGSGGRLGARCTASAASSRPRSDWRVRSPQSNGSSHEPGSIECSLSTRTALWPSTPPAPRPDGVSRAAMTTEAAPSSISTRSSRRSAISIPACAWRSKAPTGRRSRAPRWHDRPATS